MQAYQQLERLFAQLYRFNHFVALATWDSQVNSPANTLEARGLAIAELEGHIHRLLTSDDVRTWLTDASGADSLSTLQQANLREMKRLFSAESSLPSELLFRKSALTTTAQAAWVQSRADNNFACFLPTLRELVSLAREEAAYRTAALPDAASRASIAPYEALVDRFEPGMTLSRLDTIFNDVKSWLPDLLKEVLARQAQEDNRKGPLPSLSGPFPVENQEMLSRYVMETVWQVDFTKCRLDRSAHPFTGNTKEDCRITTNYTEENFTKSLLAVIHETGHAKYQMNLGPRDMSTQPVSEARSLGVHESQSLFAEKMVGRSAAFAAFLLPVLKTYFPNPQGYTGPTEISALTEDGLRRVMQRVQPTPIRVDADEVCYPLHVILRYELERDLISGKLEAEDVPAAWNEKMKAYLGVDTSGRDDLGCLQDIHWAGCAFGYFPTYSLGAMFAAQLMASIKKELGNAQVDRCIRTGDLTPILAKQKEKIWEQGSILETDALMLQATGETLNPVHFHRHLERRYLRAED